MIWENLTVKKLFLLFYYSPKYILLTNVPYTNRYNYISQILQNLSCNSDNKINSIN